MRRFRWVFSAALAAAMLGTAASARAGASAPAGDTPLEQAHAVLAEAMGHYDEGEYAAAANAVWRLGGFLYAPGNSLTAESSHFADLASRHALLTLRVNRFLYDVTPDLEPERYRMPVPYNPRIEREIDGFLTVSREEFARWLRRSGRYLPALRAAFRREGLPEDLVYIALVESGFNPRNRSVKEAVGLFQFIQSTGEMVGLKNDSWVDERRDPDKATLGAIRHLKGLYREFGDWDLALAAYNAGSGRVWKSIRAQDAWNYWNLALPPETERYVPKFYAALIISREPDVYGFSPVLESEPAYESVDVPGGVDLNTVAFCIGVSVNAVADLNPELTKGCTPPGEEAYPLRLPVGSGAIFTAAFAGLPESGRFLSDEELGRRKFKGVYVVYTVKNGDNLYTIARKHHTTVAKIIQWNPSVAGKAYIHPRQKLRIYRVR